MKTKQRLLEGSYFISSLLFDKYLIRLLRIHWRTEAITIAANAMEAECACILSLAELHLKAEYTLLITPEKDSTSNERAHFVTYLRVLRHLEQNMKKVCTHQCINIKFQCSLSQLMSNP